MSALTACGTMDEAWALFNRELGRYGVAHACYGFMPALPRKSVTGEVLVFNSHRPDFVRAYMSGNFPDHDWSVRWSMTQTAPQRWNTPEVLSRLTPDERRTEELAYDFGLYEGIVVPIRGPTPLSWGGIGLAAPDAGDHEWGGILAAHRPDLEALCQAFHETVLKHGYFETFALSARETEVLKWVVCGLNKHEIADRLNISYRTAEVHIYRIRQKLGCINDAQVVAKALVFNLVAD